MSVRKEKKRYFRNKHLFLSNLTKDRKNNNNPHGGYIYIIYIGYDSLYKIGRTTNIDTRFKSFSAANPRARLVLGTRVNDAVYAEKYLHTSLAEKRKARELFYLNRSDIGWASHWLSEQQPEEILPESLSYLKE